MRRWLATLALPLMIVGTGCTPPRIEPAPQPNPLPTLESQVAWVSGGLFSRLTRQAGHLAWRSEQCNLWDEPYWRYNTSKMAARQDFELYDGTRGATYIMRAFDEAYASDTQPYAGLACSVAYVKGLDTLGAIGVWAQP